MLIMGTKRCTVKDNQLNLSPLDVFFQVSTIFYMILLIIRNVGFELVLEYQVHASLTYSSIGILSAFIIASVILIIGVLMVITKYMSQCD